MQEAEENTRPGIFFVRAPILALFPFIAGSSAIRVRARSLARPPTARAERRTPTTRQHEGKACADGPRRPTNYVRARPDDNRRQEAERELICPEYFRSGRRRGRAIHAANFAHRAVQFASFCGFSRVFLYFFKLRPPRETHALYIVRPLFITRVLPRGAANLKRNGLSGNVNSRRTTVPRRKKKARTCAHKSFTNSSINSHWRILTPDI